VHATKSSRFGVATAHEPDDTTDSQNFEAMPSSQVDCSIDSLRIVNNKAEKSCSSIAEAREADEIIRKVWHALCVCELPSAEATGQESRLMETGYHARGRLGAGTYKLQVDRPQMQMPNKATFPWRTQAGW
jgi:hypothetical protein